MLLAKSDTVLLILLCVLIALILIVYYSLSKKIKALTEKKEAYKTTEYPNYESAAESSKTLTCGTANIDEETVAAITAAINLVLNEESAQTNAPRAGFYVKSIRKI